MSGNRNGVAKIIAIAPQISKVPNITLKTGRFRINNRREWCPVGL